MNSLNIRKIEIIVLDLLSEFEKEGEKQQIEYNDNIARIQEIEENIHNYKENEDIDFQVFSPRKIDNHNEEKIDRMNKEKDSIESINKSLYRQIRYYSEKVEKLQEILQVIEEDRSVEIDGEIHTNNNIEDITKVDEKILEYYDSIAKTDDEEAYPEEPENIGTETRMGWRVIKDELETPIQARFSIVEEPETNDILEDLLSISSKLERESKAIDEDYFRTKEEIKSVLDDINEVLKNIKK